MLCPVSSYYISACFLPSVFWILQEPKGLPRPPDENTVVRMWLSNAVRGLQPEEHMSWLLHWLYQTLGFQLWGTPSLWEGFPQWLSGKASTCKAGDTGDESLIPELGRSPGEGNDYPLQ